MAAISASMLYNLVACPHRVTMDAFVDPAERDKTSPFIQLLWERGLDFERATMDDLTQPFLDLSRYSGDEKGKRTAEAVERREPLIYAGRLSADDLIGSPDLLRLQGNGYVAGDIKSGAGEEGPEDLSKPKLHYAVQLALYTDILERRGVSAGRRPFIWDIRRNECTYDLDAPLGVKKPESLWQKYQECLSEARRITSRTIETLPAYGAVCKECWWYSACQARLADTDDLTLMFDLGRSKRDTLRDRIPTMTALAEISPENFIDGKKSVFPGIGADTLRKLHNRAKLIKSAHPRAYLREPLQLPRSDLEIFFDIEVDPMRDVTYLHGFIERHRGDDTTETYSAFFAENVSPEGERNAFAKALEFLQARSHGVLYFYSPYERTHWLKLQQRYPDVCSLEQLESVFASERSIDLYTDAVRKTTEWPTRDYSIKTLARYLGFQWRDAHPSGAASIEWFHRWIQGGDAAMKQRILDYNEDDCRATRVLLDGIRQLAVV